MNPIANLTYGGSAERSSVGCEAGVVLGMRKLENGKERIYYVGDDVHTLCIGATRSGKSRTIVVQSIFADNKAEGFVDTAVKILMAVVIGALVLGGLYLLFSGTVLPTLTQKIKDMFNFKG